MDVSSENDPVTYIPCEFHCGVAGAGAPEQIAYTLCMGLLMSQVHLSFIRVLNTFAKRIHRSCYKGF